MQRPCRFNPITTTTYELTYVTDAKGCESNLSDNTTLIVNEIPQVNFSSQDETCDGDIIQLIFDFTAGNAPWFVSYSVNGISTSILIYSHPLFLEIKFHVLSKAPYS